jgi:hypothetical protein
MYHRVIMIRLRWSTTGAAIGAIIVMGAGAAAIMVGRTTGKKAMIRGDSESHDGAREATCAPFSAIAPLFVLEDARTRATPSLCKIVVGQKPVIKEWKAQ